MENIIFDGKKDAPSTCIFRSNFWSNNMIYPERFIEAYDAYENLKKHNALQKHGNNMHTFEGKFSFFDWSSTKQ